MTICIHGSFKSGKGQKQKWLHHSYLLRAQKWAKMLDNPCILGGGGGQKGEKIRSGYITLAFLGAQKWAEMLHNPCVPEIPNKGDKIKAQKKQGKKRFPLCPSSCLGGGGVLQIAGPGIEPWTFDSQRHCLPTVRAISDKCLHRDGIDNWSNMVFIHY